MSRLIDLDQILYNPAHRANRAIEIANQEEVDYAAIDDPLIQNYVIFLRTGDTSTRDLFCVASAHTLHHHEDSIWAIIIEACVLAKMNNTEIVDETGIDEDIIDTYIQLFFDVRNKLHNKIWVVKTIFGKSWIHKRFHETDKPTAEEILKILAYYGGKHVLRTLLAGLGEIEEFPQSDKDLYRWFSALSESLISQHSVISGLLWKPHQRGTLRLMELQGKIGLEKQKLQSHRESLEINIQQNQQNIQLTQEQQARYEELENIEKTIRKQVEQFIGQIPWQVANDETQQPSLGYEGSYLTTQALSNTQNFEEEIAIVQNRLKETDTTPDNLTQQAEDELS